MKNLILVFFVIQFLNGSADAITEKEIATFRVPQSAYIKISVLSSLARVSSKHDIPDIKKSVNLLEMDLVNDIAYLNYIIQKYPDDSEYPKYVLDKIVVGFRDGYFNQVENLKAENLVISYDDAHVNMRNIYENIKVDRKNEQKLKDWFKKYFPKK